MRSFNTNNFFSNLYNLSCFFIWHRRQRDNRASSSHTLINNKTDANGEINSSTHSEGNFLITYYTILIKTSAFLKTLLICILIITKLILLKVKQVVTVIPETATFATPLQPLVVFAYHLHLYLAQIMLPLEVIKINTNIIKPINEVTTIIIR